MMRPLSKGNLWRIVCWFRGHRWWRFFGRTAMQCGRCGADRVTLNQHEAVNVLSWSGTLSSDGSAGAYSSYDIIAIDSEGKP